MQNIRKRPQQLRLKAFSLIESLVVLVLISFLTLSLSGSVQQVFRKSQETIFFLTFEQVYIDSQKLALSARQEILLEIGEEHISNGYQDLELPESIQLVQPLTLHFQESGGNSSLAKVQFQTKDGLVTYQLYLGSGRYKKTKT
ncbi:competence type IV pilus minor pilin ComGD [Streptococcus minor]|uniref:competence type IV pilus minor pilin ComGD n=1 Tax=Streptococcus minor TaxID=229549 RepID=UPI0003A28CDF|nr:competence type IV pilus minor pilin ComGD [Streptococcus minor]